MEHNYRNDYFMEEVQDHHEPINLHLAGKGSETGGNSNRFSKKVFA